jgi:hypothetical protein
MSALRARSLGSLTVDTGDVVCFSSDAILEMIKQLGGDVEDYEQFIERFGGVPCQFHCDGRYTVDQLIAVVDNGDTHNVTVVGGSWRRFARFLRNDEPTLDEYIARHPDQSKIGQGDNFKPRIFKRLCREHRALLIAKHNKPEPRARRRRSNSP